MEGGKGTCVGLGNSDISDISFKLTRGEMMVAWPKMVILQMKRALAATPFQGDLGRFIGRT